MPSIGNEASIYGTYSGFSDLLDGVVLVYGINNVYYSINHRAIVDQYLSIEEDLDEVFEEVEPTTGDDNTLSKLASQIKGTYYGENGSVLVIFDNGTVDYYWKDWNAPIENNPWRLDGNTIIISLSNPKCEVRFDLQGDLSAALELKSTSALWDDEHYFRVSPEAKKLDSEEWKAIIKTHSSDTDQKYRIGENVFSGIKLKTLNTGHFSVSVPSEWYYEHKGNWHYYHDYKTQNAEDGYLAICEMEFESDQTKSIEGDEAYEALMSIAEGMTKDKEPIIEKTSIHDMEAITVRYVLDDTHYINNICVINRRYALCVGYADSGYDSGSTWAIAQGFFSTILDSDESQNENNIDKQEDSSVISKRVDEDGRTIYPLRFTSSLSDSAIDMPLICYTTPATENGYEHQPVFITGKVSYVYKDDELPKESPPTFIVKTDHGSVLVHVFTPQYLLSMSGDTTPEVERYLRYMMDSTMIYTMPQTGESVKVYGTYMGYSSKMEMASIRFGLDEAWLTLDD